MKVGRFRGSPLTAAVTLVVAAATVLMFVLTTRSVDSQNEALLKNDSTQAAEYVSSIVSSFGSTLEALASGVTLNKGAPAAFQAQAKPLAQAPLTIVLARKTAAGFVVSAVAGSGFSPGQILDHRVDLTLARAGAGFDAGPPHDDGKMATVDFAIGPPSVPAGMVILEQLRIDPYLAITATQGAPFRALRAAVYGTHQARADELVLANTRSLPLHGPVAVAPVPIGTSTWWLVAMARSPLAGGFPNAAPFVILGVGLLLALATGSVVEVLVRRQRYATRLVAERTAELDASHAALLRSERLTALGEMASTIGHELRNPLAAVVNAHFMIRHSLGNALTPDVDRQLVMAERQTSRAATLTDNLMTFVRQPKPTLALLELRSVVDEVLTATPSPPAVSVVVDVPPLFVRADNDQIAQVLANLVTNGFQAMPGGGTLRITARAEGDRVALSIEDSGTGVAPGDLDRVFDPFFTTKASGTGLGMTIVGRIVEAHGGSISLENRPKGGAVAKVWLPLESSSEPVRR
jgi:signal transduction histidine kinase